MACIEIFKCVRNVGEIVRAAIRTEIEKFERRRRRRKSDFVGSQRKEKKRWNVGGERGWRWMAIDEERERCCVACVCGLNDDGVSVAIVNRMRKCEVEVGSPDEGDNPRGGECERWDVARGIGEERAGG
jgi:hypothetical protein